MGFRGTPIERLTADLNFASGKYLQAWVGYQRLAASPDKQPSDCEKGAISALEIEKFNDAKPLVDCAVAPRNASWRSWNARGVLADAQHDWDDGRRSLIAHALKLAPKEARVINNQGWSMLLRGDWAAAVPLFQQAVALDPNSVRIANNLELAKTALAADLPQRRAGEANADWAARLNDAGVAAELLGDNRRAVAAFTQALNASPDLVRPCFEQSERVEPELNLVAAAPSWLLAVFGCALVAAAIEDALRLRISNVTILFVFAGAIAAAILEGPSWMLWQNFSPVAAILMIGTFAFSAGLLGGGDVKLFAATALWFDLESALWFVALTFIAGGVVAVGYLLSRPWSGRTQGKRRERRVPYGIAIAAGALILGYLVHGPFGQKRLPLAPISFAPRQH